MVLSSGFLETPSRQASVVEQTAHRPWPLQPAEAEIELNTMPPDGVSLRGEPVLHLSERQDVVIWPLRPI